MQIVTMVMIMAILFSAVAPTLAYAAIYLQGTEVNANTLVQDAYVRVTYYDSNAEQKLAKGWIDTIGETSFTIREGGFRGKKTIAYDQVVSVIMSDESTAPVKQMNEVNRFIREMKNREIEQTKKEKEAKEEQIKREAEQAAIQRLKQRLKDKVVMIGQFDLSKREWYAHVVYTSKEGYKRTAIGQIIKQDTDHIVIRVQERGGLKIKKTIAYTDIDTLVVAKQWSDIERYRESGVQYNAKVRFKAPLVSERRMTGRLIAVKQDTLVIEGPLRPFIPGRRQRLVKMTHYVPLSSISNLEVSIGQQREVTKGLLMGVGLGIVVYVTQSPEPCPDPPDCTFAGLEELGAWILAGGTCMIFTLIGAQIKSEKWVEVPPQHLNLSFAPTSSKGLRAALTFNF